MTDTSDDGRPRIGGYVIQEEIGRGGAAVVFRALDPLNRRYVALKTLRIDSAASTRDRFLRECSAATGFQHPNIAAVYDVGVDGGQPYLAMELIEGKPLDLKRPLREVVAILAKVARALESVHLRGVVHRDLKPGNILVDAHGEPHLVDFGLALYLDTGTGPTKPGFAVGTPSYMSPEQVYGWRDVVGPATDAYALGAMLYETLTGRTPRGRTFAEVWFNMESAPEPPPPSGPAKLVAICTKAMARSSAKRYARIGQLADELEQWLRPARGRKRARRR